MSERTTDQPTIDELIKWTKWVTRMLNSDNIRYVLAIRAILEQHKKREVALVRAAGILEALHRAIQWELAPEVKQDLQEVLPLVRTAIFGEANARTTND